MSDEDMQMAKRVNQLDYRLYEAAQVKNLGLNVAEICCQAHLERSLDKYPRCRHAKFDEEGMYRVPDCNQTQSKLIREHLDRAQQAEISQLKRSLMEQMVRNFVFDQLITRRYR